MPSFFSSLGLGGLCGALTDAGGNLKRILDIGLLLNVAVPSGATQLQLGINDDKFVDNLGTGYTVKVTNITQGINNTQVFVPTAQPWSWVNGGLNTNFQYGLNDGTVPFVFPIAIAAGDILKIEYVSGTVVWNPGTSPNGAGTPPGTFHNNGSSGFKFPTFYMDFLAGDVEIPYKLNLGTGLTIPFPFEDD